MADKKPQAAPAAANQRPKTEPIEDLGAATRRTQNARGQQAEGNRGRTS